MKILPLSLNPDLLRVEIWTDNWVEAIEAEELTLPIDECL